jgi:hypothetical protein
MAASTPQAKKISVNTVQGPCRRRGVPQRGALRHHCREGLRVRQAGAGARVRPPAVRPRHRQGLPGPRWGGTTSK